jgi:hypothetical protein
MALTNALRHSTRAGTRVTVEFSSDALDRDRIRTMMP